MPITKKLLQDRLQVLQSHRAKKYKEIVVMEDKHQRSRVIKSRALDKIDTKIFKIKDQLEDAT